MFKKQKAGFELKLQRHKTVSVVCPALVFCGQFQVMSNCRSHFAATATVTVNPGVLRYEIVVNKCMSTSHVYDVGRYTSAACCCCW